LAVGVDGSSLQRVVTVPLLHEHWKVLVVLPIRVTVTFGEVHFFLLLMA